MKPEKEALLLEMLDIISQHLLSRGDFCGSDDGRRLTELRWQLMGISRSRLVPTDIGAEPLVNRPLTLPVNVDNALTVLVDQSGVTRNALIQGAIEAMIAEGRLG